MEKEVLVEVSARHVHLSQADLEKLFGVNYQLTMKKELSQPGQFACEERVDILGLKGSIKNVVILGPVRAATQVEVSLTDARTLGLSAQIRESGDIAGTSGCTLVGPQGELEISEGLIAAKRHIHLDPETAIAWDLADKEIIAIALETPERSLVLNDVVVRVNSQFVTAVHIDTDEANAAGFLYGLGKVLK